MRNVSLVLVLVSLSLHFSTYSMLRSVRSRAADAAADKIVNSVDRLVRINNIIKTPAGHRAIQQEIERIEEKEFALRERIIRLDVIRARCSTVGHWMGSSNIKRSLLEDSYRNRLQRLILGKESDWNSPGLMLEASSWLSDNENITALSKYDCISSRCLFQTEKVQSLLKGSHQDISNALDAVLNEKDTLRELMILKRFS